MQSRYEALVHLGDVDGCVQLSVVPALRERGESGLCVLQYARVVRGGADSSQCSVDGRGDVLNPGVGLLLGVVVMPVRQRNERVPCLHDGDSLPFATTHPEPDHDGHRCGAQVAARRSGSTSPSSWLPVGRQPLRQKIVKSYGASPVMM